MGRRPLRPMPRQRARLLRFIYLYQMRHGGVSPTYREMAAAMDSISISNVSRILDDIEYRGAIRRLRNRARCIAVTVPIPVSFAPDGDPLIFIPAPADARISHSSGNISEGQQDHV